MAEPNNTQPKYCLLTTRANSPLYATAASQTVLNQHSRQNQTNKTMDDQLEKLKKLRKQVRKYEDTIRYYEKLFLEDGETSTWEQVNTPLSTYIFRHPLWLL